MLEDTNSLDGAQMVHQNNWHFNGLNAVLIGVSYLPLSSKTKKLVSSLS